MSHSNRGPVLLLVGVGLLLLVVSAAGVYAGLALAERIYALLPPITADANAIGGAAMALGLASLPRRRAAPRGGVCPRAAAHLHRANRRLSPASRCAP